MSHLRADPWFYLQAESKGKIRAAFRGISVAEIATDRQSTRHLISAILPLAASRSLSNRLSVLSVVKMNRLNSTLVFHPLVLGSQQRTE
jgi:hypothetical protein